MNLQLVNACFRVELTEAVLTEIDDDETGHDAFIEKILETLMAKIIETVKSELGDFSEQYFDEVLEKVVLKLKPVITQEISEVRQEFLDQRRQQQHSTIYILCCALYSVLR